MGFYERRILPWVIHLAMQNREAERLRRRAIPHARGRVLEIGIGSGLNLPFYGVEVGRLTGLDPSPKLLSLAASPAREAPFEVELAEGRAENLTFDSWSFDTVVSTWSPCSVDDPAKVLQEVRRVLRPDGEFIFVEHGRSAEAKIARRQDRWTPVWRRCAGNCHMNRNMDALIQEAGFRVRHLDAGYLVHGPRMLTWHFEGRATPY